MKKVVKDKELLKDLFKQAADIAEEVPESMQEAAFNRALDALLSEAGLSIEPSTQTAKVRRETKKSVQPVRGDNADYLNKEMDRTKYPRLTPNLNVLDRSLMLLEAAKNDHGIDGLTSTEIANVLTEKFRIPTTYNAISMALSEAGSLVDRRKIGRSFQYRIMKPGEDHLAQLDTKSKSSSGAVKSKRSSTAVKKNVVKRNPTLQKVALDPNKLSILYLLKVSSLNPEQFLRLWTILKPRRDMFTRQAICQLL